MADPEAATKKPEEAENVEEIDADEEETVEEGGAGGNAAIGGLASQLMQNPEVLAALQGKMDSMIGIPSGYIQNKMTDEEKMAIIYAIYALLMNNVMRNTQILILSLAAFSMNRNVIVKVQDFFELTVPRMIPRMFRRYFRMYPETVQCIARRLRPLPRLSVVAGYNNISLIKKVSMACAYLGSSTTILQLSHLFNLSDESFLRVTSQVIDGLIDIMDEVIIWPNENELHMYSNHFDAIGRFFPNVIAAIDDIHLEIKLTEERAHHRSYFCWKQYYSIHLQAVATYDLRFLDVFVGWPGRSHDSRVFQNNPLFRTLPSRLRHRAINRLSESYHIVGDSAFPCSPQLLTTFKKPRHHDLGEVESKFNTHLASKRNNVERAFALLLQRFPRLLKLNQRTLQKKVRVVLACCVLHNICILENDNIQFYLDIAMRRRYRALDQRYRPLGTDISSRLGALKRQQIANFIFMNS